MIAFPERDRSLRSHGLAPLGLLAGCRSPVATTCLALDDIDARGWSSYGGWGSHADGSMRRAWVRTHPSRGSVLLLGLMQAIGGGSGSLAEPGPDRGWLNLVVLPDAAGTGSIIEVRGDLDAEMYVSVRSVVRSLFATVTRVWDPTGR